MVEEVHSWAGKNSSFVYLQFVCLFVAVCGGPLQADISETKGHPAPPPPPQSTIVSSYDEELPDGIRRYGFVTSDGYAQDVILTPIQGEEGGTVYKQEGRWIYYCKYIAHTGIMELKILIIIHNVFSFVVPDGTYVETRYIADQDGFRLLK